MKWITFLLFFYFEVSYAKSENFVLLDVRSNEEYSASHIQGALHFDVDQDDFKNQISKLNKNRSYKIYCKSGKRAERAFKLMKSAGFNAENWNGINQAFKKANLPCEGLIKKCD